MPVFSSWGNYPSVTAEQLHIDRLPSMTLPVESAIPRAFARSYGDSALAERLLSTQQLNHFLSFDEQSGLLQCDAGVSLDDILTTFVPKGWFLPVTPGTKFISIGGAIASDVHGKNHHVDGCFSQYVKSFTLMIGEQCFNCSTDSHADLFYATCGGMGLTGLIVDACIQLVPIKSAFIQQTVIKAPNLAQVLALFEQNNHSTYSVAWIDCLASGQHLGRSLLMLGEHTENGSLIAHRSSKLSIPCNLPSFCLNKFSIKAFNALYYHKQQGFESHCQVHYDPYFYPLDSLQHWNRLYGKKGFTQYQCVIPKNAGLEGLTEVLSVIAESGKGSFLAVLKAFGAQNNNVLSFPIEGYTLALDFKIEPHIFALLDQLDIIVQRYGGRLYLAKDARMSEVMFKASYKNWEAFQEIREKYGAMALYNSLQSKRIGL